MPEPEIQEKARGRKIVIFGLGDFARLAAFYFENDSPFEVVAFTATEPYINEREWLGKPVVAFERLEQTHPPDEVALFVAIGFRRINQARAQIYESCKAKGYQLVSYVSSTAVNLGGTRVGDNCFFLENVVIQPFASIGNDVVIWAGSHIGHDSTIGDHVFIAPAVAVSGNVKVEPYCFIGINATLRDGITIGKGCVIGAGATVLRDTAAESVCASEHIEPTPLAQALPKGF